MMCITIPVALSAFKKQRKRLYLIDVYRDTISFMLDHNSGKSS